MALLTRQLDNEEKTQIAASVEKALGALGQSASADTEEVVKAAGAQIDKEQSARTQKKLFGLIKNKASDPAEVVSMIGAVWGAQIKRQMGWDWVMAMRGEEPELALVSADREYAVFPMTFVRRMMNPPYEANTLVEVFDTIKRGRHAPAERGVYDDLTDGRFRKTA